MRFTATWAALFVLFIVADVYGKAVQKEKEKDKASAAKRTEESTLKKVTGESSLKKAFEDSTTKKIVEKVEKVDAPAANATTVTSTKRDGGATDPEVVAALTSDGKLSETTMKKMLSETNRYRLMHDATPLGNCPVCSEAAQKHVDEIASTGIVKPDHKAKYGQIIFSTKDAQDISQGADYFGTLVPARIYNQIKNYDFVKSEFKDNAADFTQLVWEGSEVVGAASKKADDDTVYVVMYFNPAGNNDTMSYYENVNRVTGAGDIDPSGRVKCPDGWELKCGNCFKSFEDSMTWPDAADHCNVLKSSLISAESQNDGQCIRDTAYNKDKWIGMSDTANAGGFQFDDGTPYVYSDWSAQSFEWLYGQKKADDVKNKCIYASKDGWGYKDCGEKLGFVCKMKPNGVLSFALDLYFPGSIYTSDIATPGGQRYNTMKKSIDNAVNSSYGNDIWFVGDTFYQFMPRDNAEVAASLLIKFAPDIRAPVDPITKLRDYLRGQNDLKILAVHLIPGVGRVSTPSVIAGTCPSGCSGDCYPECNPGCCGASVILSAPPVPSGYTACPLFPSCGTTCQQSECSQSCCQQNPYQQQAQQQCPQFPGCSPTCAPSCSSSCCQQQQQQQQMQQQMQMVQQAMQIPMQMAALQQPQPQAQATCPQSPSCSPSCAPKCSQSCCQKSQQQQTPAAAAPQMIAAPMVAAPQMVQQPVMFVQAPMQQAPNACSALMPGCSGACAPACRPTCCGNSAMRTFGGKRSKVSHDKAQSKKKSKKHHKA